MNRIKTVSAGRLRCVVCYAQPSAADDPRQRKEKQRTSSKARQMLNFRAAWQKLELLLAANFEENDLFLTLTFDDDHLPEDRDGAANAVRGFLRRLRSARRKRAADVKYVYCLESMPDAPGEDRRLHVHMILNAAESSDEIESLWRGGQVFSSTLLDSPNDGFETRARYMVKERHPGAYGRKVGLRAWNASQNLAKPETSSELVPETLTVAAPPGAYVLDRHGEVNSFGSYVYLKYLLPERFRRRQ